MRTGVQMEDDRYSEGLSSAGVAPISGGTFYMGSNHHYPKKAPAHRVTIAPFRIDHTPVTNRQFRRFVQATG